jgi:hypothetical protein
MHYDVCMLALAFWFNLVWAYLVYFVAQRVKTKFLRSFLLGMGAGNFMCAVLLGLRLFGG